MEVSLPLLGPYCGQIPPLNETRENQFWGTEYEAPALMFCVEPLNSVMSEASHGLSLLDLIVVPRAHRVSALTEPV